MVLSVSPLAHKTQNAVDNYIFPESSVPPCSHSDQRLICVIISCRQSCETLYPDLLRSVRAVFKKSCTRTLPPNSSAYFYFEVRLLLRNLTHTRALSVLRRLMSMPPRARGPNAPAPNAARALESVRQEKARYCARLPRSAALPLLQQHIALPQPRGPLAC